MFGCHCPKYGGKNIRKNGKDRHGQQKFHCKYCISYGTLQPARRASEDEKEKVINMVLERGSLRGVGRVFGRSGNTIASWLKKKRRQFLVTQRNVLNLIEKIRLNWVKFGPFVRENITQIALGCYLQKHKATDCIPCRRSR